jgi:hypothetical protein
MKREEITECERANEYYRERMGRRCASGRIDIVKQRRLTAKLAEWAVELARKRRSS